MGQIVDFDRVPLRGQRDPYPAYAAMREAGRVLRSRFGALIVHRYEDVRQTHFDHDAFSIGAGMGGGMGPSEGSGAADEAPLMGRTMLTTDPPDHERLRRVVSQAFTPRSITDLEPRVRQIAAELLAPLRRGEPLDIVADFAAPLPTIVIAELLGVPAEDAHDFRRWSEAVTGTDTRSRADTATSRRYGAELRAYLAHQVDLRKEAPTDDLIGRMVVANEANIMTDEEVVAACILLLVAGNETTMRLISNMTLALGRNPDQLERLVADPSLVPSAVEETLRYDSPVQFLFRAAKRDADLADVEVKKGQFILTMIGAANRDPEAFVDPDAYDVGRRDNHHVAFGHGIHYCLGAPLARR
ncbi:MAG TPA: cytochrome P450, partial [Acidimicrobiales bacterium]|nr:cytochrome P450 [Acidimicrobiales bacterium]